MLPGIPDDRCQEIPRHLRQPHQHRRIVPVVLGEEESPGIYPHQEVTILDRGQLEHQYRIGIPEPGQKPPIEQE